MIGHNFILKDQGPAGFIAKSTNQVFPLQSGVMPVLKNQGQGALIAKSTNQVFSLRSGIMGNVECNK